MASSQQVMLAQQISSALTYTLQQTFTVSSQISGTILPGNSAADTYVATAASANANYTLTKLGAFMLRNGGGSASNLVAKIWADSSSNVGTLLGTSTNTIASSDVTSSATEIPFYFSGVSLTNATPYWFGVYSATNDAVNYYSVWAQVGSGVTNRSADGSSWSNVSTRQWYMKTYISP